MPPALFVKGKLDRVVAVINEAVQDSDYSRYFDRSKVYKAQDGDFVVYFWNVRAANHNCWLQVIISSLDKAYDVEESRSLGITFAKCNREHPEVSQIERLIGTKLTQVFI